MFYVQSSTFKVQSSMFNVLRSMLVVRDKKLLIIMGGGRFGIDVMSGLNN